jgi:preprotein translocase subunit SecE
MAKTAVAAAPEGIPERFKAVIDRIKSFYGDVRNEMRKVSTPARKEVEATTTVVIITVFIFGLYFWIVDGVIGHTLDGIFRYFGTH